MTALLAASLILTGISSGCGKRSTAELPEIRRHSGVAGDKIIRQSGEEIVLRWDWIVKPIADE